MVDGVDSPEDNIERYAKGQWCSASPGSESTACIQRQQVNVGGPECSAKEEQYRRTSPVGEEAETVLGKSDGSYYR